MMFGTRMIAASAALLATACTYWAPVDSGNTLWRDADQRYTVELPAGWLRLKGLPETLMLSRDGLALQQIVIFTRELDKAFPRAKQKSAKGLLAHELGARQLGEFHQEGEVLAAARVAEVSPATVGGRPGYRLYMEWTGEDGVPMVRVAHGTADAKHYYMIGFEAPRLHYDARYRPAFEAMVASFRLTAVQPPPATSAQAGTASPPCRSNDRKEPTC
jgi:hypothetical protein